MNITDFLDEHARDRPDHPAIEDGESVVRYVELLARVNRAATNLRHMGVRAADVVVIMLQDSCEHIVVLCAIARLGAVSMSLNPFCHRSELERAVKGFDLRAVITQSESSPIPGLQALRLADICNPNSANAGEVPPATARGGNQPLIVVQSSGTTGDPKRLILSHEQLRARNRTNAKIVQLTSSDRFLLVPGVSFLAGWRRALTMLQLGGTIVINYARTFADYLQEVDRKNITFTFLTTAHLLPMVAGRTDRDPLFRGLKIVLGASHVPPDLRARARAVITPTVLETYGTNEVGDLTVATPEDQEKYPGSVGRVIDGVEFQVVDGLDNPLPPQSVGQVRVRAQCFPSAYLGSTEAAGRAFRDGWFYPGDLAHMNDEGYVFLMGRADDVINNSGVKFYPAEIEDVLLAHPDVAQAAVFGWPHFGWGEVAVACVVRSSDVSLSTLSAFCRERLPSYRMPAWILFQRELPRNATNKVVKAELRKIFSDHLREHESEATKARLKLTCE